MGKVKERREDASWRRVERKSQFSSISLSLCLS
jgi:hypothetical protein